MGIERTITGRNELGGRSSLMVRSNGRAVVDNYLQDQDQPAVVINFNRITDTTTIATETAIGDLTIVVDDASGITAGDYLIAYSTVTHRFYIGEVISISVNTLTVDTPLDSALPVGTAVTSGIKNMAVNGSVTPQVFGIRGQAALPEGVDVTFDVTRIIFDVITTDPVDLSTFADITGGLTNGLVLRKRDGEYYNIFNIKTNGDIAGIAYDWTPESAQNSVQGQNGFYARLTFAGQHKMGVVQRLQTGDDLEFVVQDDLSSIETFNVVAQGHIVEL